MDSLIQVLTGLTPLITVLVGTGLVAKYAPFMKWLPNQLIPLLNALITFLTAFNPEAAHAGIFGDVARGLSLPAKLAASAALSAFATVTYEVYGRNVVELIQKLAGKTGRAR